MSCAEWLKLIAAYKAGQITQASADKAAGEKEIRHDLEARADVDRRVGGMSDADRDAELSKWQR